MKSVLCGVESSDGLGEGLLLELILDRQAQLSKLFDVGARMKLHLLEFSENGKRLLQLRWVWLLFRFSRSGSFNGGNPSYIQALQVID